MSGDALQLRTAPANSDAAADASYVPDGYKRTEVGLIPVDWRVSDLGAICSFENGDRGANYPSPGSFVSEGIPFINAGHLDGGRIALRDMDYITRAAFNRLGGGKVHRGDILFCLRGTLGKFGVVEPGFGEGAIASSLVIVRPRGRDLIGQFLAFYFASDLCARMIEKWAGGAAQPNLGAQDLARFSMPIPPAPEQHAISEVLSDVNGLLGALEMLIDKKRALKQAAMQQLLTGKTRLPGFSGEWETKRLGDIAHIKTGTRNNEEKAEDGQYPFYVRSENVERINTYSHDCEAILVPGEGRIGSIFHYVNGRFDVHQRVYAITHFTQNMSARFVHAYMTMRFGVWAMQNTVKATVDSLRLPTFQLFEMRVPPSKNEQTAIATVLSDMDAEIAALEARREKTRAIMQGMMQQLLSGRVRLVKPTSAKAST
jgi:type I restriction enzyme S subunit